MISWAGAGLAGEVGAGDPTVTGNAGGCLHRTGWRETGTGRDGRGGGTFVKGGGCDCSLTCRTFSRKRLISPARSVSGAAASDGSPVGAGCRGGTRRTVPEDSSSCCCVPRFPNKAMTTKIRGTRTLNRSPVSKASGNITGNESGFTYWAGLFDGPSPAMLLRMDVSD